MNVTFDKLSNVTGRLTVKLDEADYAEKIKKQLKEIAQKRPEPGFRAGHVPMGIVQKKYGKAVKYDVVNREVSEAVYNYLKDSSLRVLGNPVPETKEEFNLEAKDYEFSFMVGLAPEIDTHVDKNLHVPFYTIKVSDEMIDEQDKQIRRRLGSQVPADDFEEAAMVKGVITELDVDGKPKADGLVQENGILLPMYFKSDEQKALFVGKKVGDTVVFNPSATCEGSATELSSMLNVDKEKATEYTGDFSIEIKEFIVPRDAELNQETFDNAFGKDNVHDEKEYREAIKQMIARQLSGDSNYRFTLDAKECILKAVGEVELPDEVLKDYLEQQNEQLNAENIDAEYAKVRPELVWQIVSDEIASKLQVKVNEEDVKNIARMATQNQFAQYGMQGVQPEIIDKYAESLLADEKAREQFARQAYDMATYEAIRNAVTLDEKEVSVEEFNALFAAPAAE